MQAIAAEFNFSETTFVFPPDDPAHTARVRIFHRTAELPFAGHPNVGTAFVLGAMRGEDTFVFEELAGLVTVEVHRTATGAPFGATITAPQPLGLGDELSVGTVSACIGLAPGDVVVRRHQPRWASTGNLFVLAEVSPDALSKAAPDVAAFRRAAARHAIGGRLSIYLYARSADCVRARMFAPLSGTWEDAATGSAAAPLGALLLSLNGADHAQFDIVQGVEMGRPSRLRVTARRRSEGIVATVGGTCVAVTEGTITL
jgi:trans-2,3-dihydro-3-hydroxyanthranilate isomerase